MRAVAAAATSNAQPRCLRACLWPIPLAVMFEHLFVERRDDHRTGCRAMARPRAGCPSRRACDLAGQPRSALRSAADHDGSRRRRLARARLASSRVRISPLTMTGICTASFTARTAFQSAIALVELTTGAAMHGDRVGCPRLRRGEQVRRIDDWMHPSQAASSASRELLTACTVASISRSAWSRSRISADPDAMLVTMLGRATHVDVDDVGALGLRDTGALRHPTRLTAGELDRFDGQAPPIAAPPGLAAVFDQRRACRHLRNDEARPELLGHAAERRIGDAGHRGQNHPICERDRANRRTGFTALLRLQPQECLSIRRHNSMHRD